MRYPGRSFIVLVMTPWVSVKTAGRALFLSAAAAAAGVDEEDLVCYVVREAFDDERKVPECGLRVSERRERTSDDMFKMEASSCDMQA
jgi:hypothetical protein